jgi:uncharacterized protein YqhQ|tara:strand:- start:425 stop:1309 length:885 start_codon:yes stop_codon:yes gene_type:complete
LDLSKTIRLGGQALPEGILIKGPKYTVIAYRDKSNEIDFVSLEWNFKFFDYLRKIPLIRGLIAIFETFSLSIKSIFVMAEISDDEINLDSIYFKLFIGLMFVVVIFLTLGIIIFVPKLTAGLIAKYFLFSTVFKIWIELFIRFSIFFFYIFLYRFFAIGKKMFQYHAAEHMSIHAYENQELLTKDNLRKFNKEHPRCGTAFLAFVFIYANIVFHIIDFNLAFVFLFLVRLFISLFIISITYETLLLGWKSNKMVFGKIINFPGYILQKITTMNPCDDDLDLAIVATNKCVELHK